MEGNLRGARDLVSPLTAANLKRAASLGSEDAYRGHYGGDGFRYDSSGQKPLRSLQPQSSSPTMRRDYQVGHWRGFSDGERPERPLTSLDHINDQIRTTPQVFAPSNNYTSSTPLRGSKSYDSLGGNGGAARWPNSREPLYIRGSPDPALNRVDEDETPLDFGFNQNTTNMEHQAYDRGTHSPSPRPDDLRNQMTSLKGKISSLKQRAREDSLRRRSLQTLREPSPLNNAATDAPDFYHTTSPNLGHDLHMGKNALVDAYSYDSPQHGDQRDGPSPQKHASRYEDYDETQRDTTQAHLWAPQNDDHEHKASIHHRSSSDASTDEQYEQRYTNEPFHHDDHEASSSQSQPRRSSLESEQSISVYEDAPDHHSAPVAVAHEDREDAFNYENFFLHSAMRIYGRNSRGEEEDEEDEEGESRSVSSEDSNSSISTARGDASHAEAREAAEHEDYDDTAGYEADNNSFDSHSSSFNPQTPEKLRQIEQRLQHKRVQSNESVSTLATFATADEGYDEDDDDDQNDAPPPAAMARQVSIIRSQPSKPSSRSSATHITTTQNIIRAHQKQNSLDSHPRSTISSQPQHRPATAIPLTQLRPSRSDSSSERADSGVGMSPQLQLQQQQQLQQYANATTTNSITKPLSRKISPLTLSKPPPPTGTHALSPPMSPSAMMFAQDPATVIVNTLLGSSSARKLGLKDKALLFGVVEGLRRTVSEMQRNEDQRLPEGKAPRRRLEEARKALDGIDGSRR